ncbi:MAG: 2OG-Fe(II) oxygenase [Acidimicrobiales bacterium]
MSESARDQLAALLGDLRETTAFSATRTATAEDLQITVRGVGQLSLPVLPGEAELLRSVARPARYGQGEETLLDRRVRDTWEVPRSRVKIDARRWHRRTEPILRLLARDLGVKEGRALEARLHSMLLYAPGQFFSTHQDSERADSTIGSLVVMLPSQCSGGVLEIVHRGAVARYRGSKKALSFVAFYGDCRHQVTPVRSGHRVVLTYDLVVSEPERGEREHDLDEGRVEAVRQALDEHFATAREPERLVFLLDHEYTPHSLSWARLKGPDADAARLLRSAAARSGYETVLALADVHEIWSAYPSGSDVPRRTRDRYEEWEDTEDLEGDDAESVEDSYDLEELIDSTVTLEWWLDAPGTRSTRVHLLIAGDAVCTSTPSENLSPYSTEYEGYMGNYGNTLDRWYHRGAVALWPFGRSFATRAEASPPWAVRELSALAGRGELGGAREAAASLAEQWHRTASRVEENGFFSATLQAAHALDNPRLATMLLAPFGLEELTAADASELSALTGHYGEQWTGEIVRTWSATRGRATDQATFAWTSSLVELCNALHRHGADGTAAARAALRAAWSWAEDAIERGRKRTRPSERERDLAQLVRPFTALTEAVALSGASELSDEIAATLSSGDDLLPLAIGLLRATRAARWQTFGLGRVVEHWARVLRARLARTPRVAGDWSIDLSGGCRCELCDRLARFLANPTERMLEWPIRQDRREHVHQRIADAELPVEHRTRRTGSPYTLVLTKTDELFELEALTRRQDARDLKWVESQRTP